MKLKLLLRRLTVSAPRMAVRSALPWPVRWISVALVAGFCAALGLWAFELGKELAGLDHDIKAELQEARIAVQDLKVQLEQITVERDKSREVANTAETLVTAEKVARARLTEINQQLTEDVQRLRDDLGFFEQLVAVPAKSASTVSVRGLQARVDDDSVLQWQALIVQAAKNPMAFEGALELVFSGVRNGQVWSQVDAESPRRLSFKQYARINGKFAIPTGVKIKTVVARLREGQKVIATETANL